MKDDYALKQQKDDLINTLKNKVAELTREVESNKQQKNTDEKRELEYQESQTRFRTVFEASKLGNKIISSDLKILQVNAAMLSILGYETKEEIIGLKIVDFSPPEYHHDWTVLQENLWAGNSSSFSLETRLKKRDGSLLWCQVTSILFMDKGIKLGYTIIEDVNEQHILRQQKEEFISVASHELKTPITSLKAYLQLINRKLNSETEISESLIKLGKNAELFTIKLIHLVEDLLSSTKIEQGQLSLNRSTFLVSDVVESCCNHLEINNKYYITPHGDRSITIYADQYKIEQVLINLVNNAIKYAPDSLEIVISTEQLENKVKVSVTDKGPGIAEENVPQLFDRYFRVDYSGNQNSGLGLGLYISAEIIKRHRGEMGVESELGNGTTFWFIIPD